MTVSLSQFFVDFEVLTLLLFSRSRRISLLLCSLTVVVLEEGLSLALTTPAVRESGRPVARLVVEEFQNIVTKNKISI